MSKLPTVHFEYGHDSGRSSFSYENGDSEELLVSSRGADLYRLEESSFAGGAVYGDTIRARKLQDGTLRFVEIVERSTLETQSWILSKEILEAPGMQSILDFVIKQGGSWERAFGGLLLVHTPPAITREVYEKIDAASN
jgi:hypothetical protein